MFFYYYNIQEQVNSKANICQFLEQKWRMLGNFILGVPTLSYEVLCMQQVTLLN